MSVADGMKLLCHNLLACFYLSVVQKIKLVEFLFQLWKKVARFWYIFDERKKNTSFCSHHHVHEHSFEY